MMLSGAKSILPLLVLLSVGQSVLASPNLLSKKKGQPGAFNIGSLTINQNSLLKEGAYIMLAKYAVKKDAEANAKVICGNSNTKHNSFIAYQYLYHGDYNAYEPDAPFNPVYSVIKKFVPKTNFVCYLVVERGCGTSADDVVRYSNIKQSEKLKIYTQTLNRKIVYHGSVEKSICVTNSRAVIGIINYLRPFKSHPSYPSQGLNDNAITEVNDRVLLNLVDFYKKIEPGLEFEDASEIVRNDYERFALPTINPPSYQHPPQYRRPSIDSISGNTPSSSQRRPPYRGFSTDSMSNNQDLPPEYTPTENNGSFN
ncbi:hypothetical protein BDF19DRAFT_438566 [Syncephalis fuscata]|nr:hypothetical protein BDF19DRAFT_438566 [Syncephalis fuscata]